MQPPGIGPVLAGRLLLARTGRPDRLPTAAAFANYCEVAPIEIASADSPAIASPTRATGNSTPHYIRSPSSRFASLAVPDVSTTTGRSQKARPPRNPDDASKDVWPTTYGAP
ncbi:transposase [Streptomyces sp. NPDC097610]|uniref:transposase n=1 Tax=Streptomyces sp. NPDC097610 TaxID=3157227 RepID=UPI00331A707E